MKTIEELIAENEALKSKIEEQNIKLKANDEKIKEKDEKIQCRFVNDVLHIKRK